MLKLEGNSGVSVIEMPEPVPGPGEVVVKTVVSALCGSEMHSYRGAGSATGNGGHEAAGTICAIGPEVTTLTIGQRVGLSAVVGCGQCDYCAKGQYTWCAERRFYGNMHAERILIAARGCHPLPDDVPWDAGVLLAGDGLGVPYHTSLKMADPAIKTIAIFGVGPIGLGHTLLQTYLGRQVIAVDIASLRLEQAQQLGAAHVINSRETDPVAQILRLTDGRGADVCLEAAGRPETLKLCFAAVRTGGLVVMNGEQGNLELSPSQDFIRRDITALGAWYYHFAEFSSMLALYRQGLAVTSLITDHYPLAEAATAFQEFAAGRTGKVILTMQ